MNTGPHLVKPCLKYKKSFLEALNEPNYKLFKRFRIDGCKRDFKKYIDKIKGYSKGVKLLGGVIPETTYWLIDKGEFIGRVSIRHELTKKSFIEGGHIGCNIRSSKQNKGYGKLIIKFALLKARKLGIYRVLLTCEEDNIASRKIIEANGGVYEDKIANAENKSKKLRFWIENE